MEDEHWSNEFEHESLSTDEARESFTKAMSKYDSPESAIMGGFEAMKLTGRPYKLPESIDKLPDDNVKKQFQDELHKVLGVIDSKDAFGDDFNFAEGLEDGRQADENIVETFKDFAVKNNFTRQQAQAGVNFWNGMMRQAREAEAQKAKDELGKVNEALKAEFGDKVDENIELMRRTFQNNAGLSAEEFEQIADDLMETGTILRKPVLAKAIVKLLAPMSKEGGTDTGEGGTKQEGEGETIEEQLPKTAKALGW